MPKTVEELEAELEALQTAKDAADTAAAALKTKNAQLITEKRKIREERDALKAKQPAEEDDEDGDDEEDDEDDVDDAAAIAEARARRKAKAGGLSAAETKAMIDRAVAKATKKSNAELAELKADKARLESVAADKSMNEALDEALAAANVAVPYRKAARAMFRTMHKISLVDGEVMCDEEPVKDSVASWVETDEGKAFVAAPSNGGSAAPGGPVGAPTKKRSEMTPAEKAAFTAKFGVAKYEQLPK